MSFDNADNESVVLVEQRDRILVITINRPAARNAVNAAVSHGLAEAMDRLDADPGLSVGWSLILPRSSIAPRDSYAGRLNGHVRADHRR